MSREPQPADETKFGEAMVRLAINLGVQLAMMDGGSLVTVRAVLARAMDTDPATKHPSPYLHSKLDDTWPFISERIAIALIRAGIEPKR